MLTWTSLSYILWSHLQSNHPTTLSLSLTFPSSDSFPSPPSLHLLPPLSEAHVLFSFVKFVASSYSQADLHSYQLVCLKRGKREEKEGEERSGETKEQIEDESKPQLTSLFMNAVWCCWRAARHRVVAGGGLEGGRSGIKSEGTKKNKKIALERSLLQSLPLLIPSLPITEKLGCRRTPHFPKPTTRLRLVPASYSCGPPPATTRCRAAPTTTATTIRQSPTTTSFSTTTG